VLSNFTHWLHKQSYLYHRLFAILPLPRQNPDRVDSSIEMAVAVFQKLADVLTDYLGHKPLVASSYGYAAPSDDPEMILALMQKAVDECGYTGRIAFALDCASSEMDNKETNTYLLKGEWVYRPMN
jgi:enolase